MSVPSPDAVLTRLHRLWPPLYTAFERGTQVAREFFAQHQTPPAPWVYPDIVRWQALRSLKAEGFDAEALELRGLPNNGILIRHEGYTLRVMKALPDGSLPGPGPSAEKQQFFQQLCLGQWGEEIRNLVLLWHPDELFNLDSLSLACPKDGEGTKAESHWQVPIPHPAVGTLSEIPAPTATDDLEIDLDEASASSAGEQG